MTPTSGHADSVRVNPRAALVRRVNPRAGDRVVSATTRLGLDILMTGVQPHPADRRGL